MRKRTRILYKHFAWLAARWALLPAALLGIRLGWGLEATHRLAAQQAALRGLGIPVTPADLPDPARVHAEQDAVIPFQRARSHFKLSDSDTTLVSLGDKNADLDRVQFTPDELTRLHQLWDENQAVIADLDLSESRPLCAWPIDFDFYFGPRSQGSWINRILAQFLAERALVEAADHHDAQALHQLHRILNIARINGAQPMFLATLSAFAIRTLAVQMLERLEPQLNWGDGQVIAEARTLLADFQACDHPDLLNEWKPEFAFNHYWVGKRPAPLWWIEPLFADDEARVLRIYAAYLPALRAASFPEFKAILAPPAAPAPPGDSQFSRTLGLFSDDADFSVNFGWIYYVRATDVRAAELLLAARLYQHDHGTLPPAAADLVPQYLPSLPVDLLDPLHQPLRYRLDAAAPTVWSVGENGSDQGGAGLLAINGGTRFRRHPDIVYGSAWRTLLSTLPAPP